MGILSLRPHLADWARRRQGVEFVRFQVSHILAFAVTPVIIRAAGCPYTATWDWGDGTAQTTGDAPTHNYAGAGTYTVTLRLPQAQRWLTSITLFNDRVIGAALTAFRDCRALTAISVRFNAGMNQDCSRVDLRWWPNLTNLQIQDTAATGDISGWMLPAGLTYLDANDTMVSGDVSGWVLPAGLDYLDLSETQVSGDLSGWVLPATLTELYLYQSNVAGDVSGWIVPAGMTYLGLNQTGLSGAPSMAAAEDISDYQYQDCGLVQADVDAVLQQIYLRRMAFTDWPSLDVSGTNAAPSGVYADEDPPVTGKGMAFEMVMDPEAEGFNQWMITFTP